MSTIYCGQYSARLWKWLSAGRAQPNPLWCHMYGTRAAYWVLRMRSQTTLENLGTRRHAAQARQNGAPLGMEATDSRKRPELSRTYRRSGTCAFVDRQQSIRRCGREFHDVHFRRRAPEGKQPYETDRFIQVNCLPKGFTARALRKTRRTAITSAMLYALSRATRERHYVARYFGTASEL
jgi:hypothetical protein